MARRIIAALLAGSSLATGAVAAHAQSPPAPQLSAPVLGEIVVTARRRAESLQEVPQTVAAVQGETLNRFEIKRFEDVQRLVPGLSLAPNPNGYQSAISLRGVTFDPTSAAPSTVATYVNDASVETGVMFNALFDIGQIEVLRGPQGTTRGVAAPSGAITVTTRRPNLEAYGGYGSFTYTDRGGRNIQAAVNLPMIDQKLGVRIATVFDQNRADQVRSLNNASRPRQVNFAGRITLAFAPTDDITSFTMWQHTESDLRAYDQVLGPGNGFNPPIGGDQRLSVEDGPNLTHYHLEHVTEQFDAKLFGQHLSYVGSYVRSRLRSLAPLDTGNLAPRLEIYQNNHVLQEITTHELRLASDPEPGRFLDYTLGVFYLWQNRGGHIDQAGTYLPGAFGPPGTFDTAQVNGAYQVPVFIEIPATAQETSLFGSITAHLGSKAELTGGVRQITRIDNSNVLLTTGSALAATKLPVPIPCSFAGLQNSLYPGFCDARVPAGVVQSLARRSKGTPTIYNVQASYHVNRDLMLYANTGSSWRPGPSRIGVFNVANDPTVAKYIFLPDETSKAYELGFKANLGGRGRLNVAVFRQRFHNLIFMTQPAPYVSTNGASTTVVPNQLFIAFAPAEVNGFDVDAAFQITADWNVGLIGSYADGKTKNATVPCRDANFDGIPDNGTPTLAQFQAAHTALALCRSDVAISRMPLWNATLTSEYAHPVADRVTGFVRGIFTYYPENKRQTSVGPIGGYGLLNLYAGVRSEDESWEVSLFVRNAGKVTKILDRSVSQTTTSPLSFFPQAGASGYYTTGPGSPAQGSNVTPVREVGVSLRYALGSR
jgi:iron complex outermembrane receptor protein